MPNIAELAEQVGLPFEGDGDKEVLRIRGLDMAQEGDLAFLRSPKDTQKALDSNAGALVVPENVALPGKTVIRSPFPHLTVVQLTPILHPPPKSPEGIDPRAIVGKHCSIDPGAAIHPLVSIADGVSIGAGTQIFPGVCIGPGVVIGEDCLIHSNATVEWGCQIGNRVIIHSGSVIGSDGFGYVTHEGRHVKIPHLGIVVLEDDVEIGGGNSIDRATYGETTIRQGVKTDNLVHIAHNVDVGEHTLLAGQVGIAGSSKIGHHVIMAGQSGVLDHMSIAPGVIVGPKSVMTRSGKEGGIYYGYPARPQKDWQRAVAHLNGLDKLVKRLNKLLGKRNSEEDL